LRQRAMEKPPAAGPGADNGGEEHDGQRQEKLAQRANGSGLRGRGV
jgi:hypothetical protein